MLNLLSNVSPSSGQYDIILLIGLGIFFGTIGARIFRLLHIPQIIGYVTVGILLGPVLKVISVQTVTSLEPFNMFALGIIGFLIGGELKRDVFVKFGKQVLAILAFEGLTAFLLVFGLSFICLSFFHTWQMSLAAAIVFGAICAATDPASTVSVLWEYKARGPLTTMLTAIVALDDALALVLYIVSVSIAGVLTGSNDSGILVMIAHSIYEVVGSLVLGAAAGLLLKWFLKKLDEEERTLVFTIGIIILTIGLARTLGLDVILSSMALGVTLINSAPRRSLRSFEIIRRFSPPVYVLFFVIIGARMTISNINSQIWLLVAAYVIGSIVGKTGGSYLGAIYSKAVPTVRKYLGFCLYQQGTIAVALLMMASTRFEEPVKSTMLSVIILGVFILQLLGPLCTKIGVKKAGEVGLNITEDDLIATHTVADVMDKEAPVIDAGQPLSEVIKTVSTTNSLYYPVLDQSKKLIGVITLDGIRNTFTTQELNDWLVALDIAEPVIGSATPKTTLAEAFENAKSLDIEHIPVIETGDDGSEKFVALLDCRRVRRSLSAEVLARQQQADKIHNV